MQKKCWDGITVELTYKNIKRLNMRIKSGDKVQVSAPLYMSEAKVRAFVLEHRDWIIKHQERFARRAARGSERRATNGSERGADTGDYVDVEAMRHELRARIAARLPMIEEAAGLHCSGWTVRKMTTRLGSCNTRTHHINFSLMLANEPDELLDYVIVHELVHTKVANHGPEFKAYMDRLMPDWRERQKELRG